MPRSSIHRINQESVDTTFLSLRIKSQEFTQLRCVFVVLYLLKLATGEIVWTDNATRKKKR